MFKKKDLILTAHLRVNSRESLTKLSRMTGVPVSTIFDRLKTNDIIVKNTALLDFAKLGYGARATILLRAKKGEKDQLGAFLAKSLNINSLYKINNGFHYLAECIFRDVKELENFIDSIDEKFSIRSKEVHYIIDDIKREEFLSQPDLIDLLSAS
ncbi:Lrp/AsnC family transcriptional regulator [Candidatus Woesearchaeota archaeon]|nr:Lrp/AsnC family transcriptional regulator [Candidatus Woesearchaeota archaeon]MBW2994315.1 Lrp/AsnC family transcriptional regulator [Candidatus Woesearchaeota archaeon]